jgi:hypothetical protein
MKLNMTLSFLAPVFIAIFASAAIAQDADDTAKLAQARQASLRRMVQDISTKEFQEKVPFSAFLDGLSKRLSEKTKFTVRLDRAAFAKNADKILAGEIELPPVPARMTAKTALRVALSQTVAWGEIELVPGKDEFIITTRDRSLYTAEYDIGNLVKHTRFLNEEHNRIALERKDHGSAFFPGEINTEFEVKADPDRPDEWIVSYLVPLTTGRAGWRHPTRPSTIKILGGTKLIVHAPPTVHETIGLALDSLGTMTKLDVAVVMNARLYDLDRKKFEMEFAPLFVDAKDKAARRLAVTLTEQQLKLLRKQKLVMTAEPTKLRAFRQGAFISRRTAHQYVVGPGDPDERPGDVFATVYDGFAFSVRPIISPDRTCLRLAITQEASQLVKFTKGAIVDLKTGKEVAIDLPNVKKSLASATIEIHDGTPIALAVDHQPAQDRVWLVLAEPTIFGGWRQAAPWMPLADEKPEPAEPEPEPRIEEFKRPPAVQLPDNDDVKAILQAVIQNALTDKEVSDLHDFYGTKGDKQFDLDCNAHQFLWPKNFRPVVPGYSMYKLDPGICQGFRNRVMGFRIDGFSWDPTKPAPKEVHIDLAIHNVGGTGNGGVIGGCHVQYVAERKGNHWVVHWTMIECH